MKNELKHHGVKGMKWGIRRFQKKDGSLTDAGKKRYDDASLKKLTHRQKLEQKYIQKGMSKKQAEMAADRRIKTEKIVGFVAAVSATVVTAYAINKGIDEYVDKTLKTGKTLQRIEGSNTGGKLFDEFFASHKKYDNTLYVGMLGGTRQAQNGKAYIMNLRANKDIKIASPNSSKKVFEQLFVNDKDFRESVEDIVRRNSHFDNKVDINNPKNIGKMYENFNSHLVGQNHKHPEIQKFYNAMKDKGYNAIHDINDKKFSGYKAKNPLILFDVKDKITVDKFAEMKSREIYKYGKKVQRTRVIEDLLKNPSAFIVTGTIAGTKRVQNTKKINEYRLEHPNTKLSDKEILETLKLEQYY